MRTYVRITNMTANPHLATETVTAGQRAGARCELHVYNDQEHGVNDDEIVAVRTLLTDLLERSA